MLRSVRLRCMNTWWKDLKFVLLSFFIWRLSLLVVELCSGSWWQPQFLFFGASPWANFDGLQYIVIATQGYLQYQQAYFPLYPLLIGLIHTLWSSFPPVATALIFSHTAFVIGLFLLYRFAKEYGEDIARWTVLLLLSFPTSFYFASAYTESLFFCLSVAVILACRNKRFGWASVIGLFAASTRLFGILLWPYVVWRMWQAGVRGWRFIVTILIPLGLVSYMAFLWHTTGDPLAFVHVQPFFGAHRTGGALVLLPQVLWRYIKIFVTVSPAGFTYWVAGFEMSAFLYGAYLVVRVFLRWQLIALTVYSALVLLLPTLTGTLSSLPRYMLSAFPLFIVAAKLHNNRTKTVLVFAGIIGLVVGTSLYLAGFFIS